MCLLEESVLTLAVLPNDIDISKISDDRYFALMDLGRMNIVFRTGLLRSMIKKQMDAIGHLQHDALPLPVKDLSKIPIDHKDRVVG